MKKQPEVTAATRQKLIDAFWSVFTTKDIDKITIAEITRIAEYNRGTFYEYFVDIYDLLDQVEDDLILQVKGQIEDILEKDFPKDFPKDLSSYSLKCAKIFRQYEDKIFVLLGPHGDPKFHTKLQDAFLTVFNQYAIIPEDIQNLDYLITFAFSGIVGMLTHWYEKGKDLTEDEFVKMVQTLVAVGAVGYTKESL
ncbi:MAG: TetR/AcrR family transcriptional regulator [Lachnospiraceae bacterium]|nr:TetR/AcrR family transcriptional regulator [Lachnospiraceae bacterium]